MTMSTGCSESSRKPHSDEPIWPIAHSAVRVCRAVTTLPSADVLGRLSCVCVCDCSCVRMSPDFDFVSDVLSSDDGGDGDAGDGDGDGGDADDAEDSGAAADGGRGELLLPLFLLSVLLSWSVLPAVVSLLSGLGDVTWLTNLSKCPLALKILQPSSVLASSPKK